MSANISINPALTTNAAGSFNVESVGYVQGIYMDDPAVRFALAGGVLKSDETLPMWGGVAIFELVAGNASDGYLGSPGGPSGPLGGQVGRATALSGSKPITGFSVFNQAHAMINSPQSPVPTAGVNGQVNFFRLGSGARIAVACDPILAAYAGANLITTPVAWDFVNQKLIPQVTSINVSAFAYDSPSGTVTLTMASSPGVGVGDSVTIAGLTGTGSIAQANGTFTTVTGTSGTTIKYVIASGLTLSYSTGGTLTTGSALSVKLLDLNIGNSMTVSYDSVNNYATWNRSGSTALIQI